MKKSIKSIVLGIVTAAMLTGCFGEGSTSSDSQVSGSNSSSNTTSETTTSSSSATTSTTSSTSTSTSSSASTSTTPSSSSSSSSSAPSIVVLTQITLTAPKTTLEINEEVLISSNVEGVTFTTGEGASVTNNVFKATKAGNFVVTAHKDGDFIDGTLEITVLEAKQDIVLSAEKTNLDLNESVTINSNVEGVTLTTTEGATIENGVFTASKAGTYVVTGTKEGRYNDGTITISVAFAQTEAKVKNALKALKEGQNYTLQIRSTVSSADFYRTPNYSFHTLFNEGMGLFTNIIPNQPYEKVAHYIKLVGDELVIGNDVVYNIDDDLVIATDLYDVDGLYFIDIDKVEFEEHDGHFVTDNEDLIGFMANIIGVDLAYFASAIQYSFNDKYELVANLLYAGLDGNIDYTSTSMLGDLVYTNVGQTKAPVVDEAYSKVTVGSTGMSEEVASSFMLKEGHIKATIKTITGDNEELLGTSEYNFDEKYLIEDKNVIKTNQIIHKFYTNDNGYAKYIGIGPNNTIVTSPYGEWDSFTFPFATLDATQFRQTGEHTYSYLGFNSHAVACNLAWASVGDNQIAYITAQEKDGKIASFTCETANMLVDISDPEAETPEYVYRKLVMEIEVLPYEKIEDPKPFEADADTVRIGAYLDEIQGEDANFTLFMGDYANTKNWKNIKVTSDTILVQEYKDSKLYGYHGYHKLSDGSVFKFSAKDESGEVNAKFEGDVELEEGQTFASLLGFNIAPETMTFDVDGNVVFKEGVMNAGYGLFNEFSYNKYAQDNTITLKVSSGHITGVTYKYDSGANATEYTSNFMYGTTALTSAFETKLLEALATLKEAPHPTTWAEESADIYNNLCQVLGDHVSLIPYVYDVSYSGNFESSVNDKGNMVTIKFIKNSGLSYSDAYKEQVIDACVANGFTKVTFKKATLVVGDKTITVQLTDGSLAVLYK